MPVQNVGYLFQLGLRKVMYRGYEEETENLDQLFHVSSTDRAYEEWTGVVGPGVAEEKPKGEDMTYKNILVETPKRVLMRTYAVGIRVHMEDVQDDQYAALKKLADMVGRSHKVVKEVNRANFMNGSFGTWNRTGYDQKAIFATDHPLQGDAGYAASFNASTGTSAPSRTATTWSNRLATDSDLDYTSFIDAVTLLRRQYSREGDFMSLAPKKLVIPPELEPIAYEITKSTDRPDTANRATSTVNRFNVSFIVSPYFLDPDAWWLMSEKHDFQWFDRMPFTTRTRDAEGSWDTLIESVHRHGYGVHDPRGGVGTPGA